MNLVEIILSSSKRTDCLFIVDYSLYHQKLHFTKGGGASLVAQVLSPKHGGLKGLPDLARRRDDLCQVQPWSFSPNSITQTQCSGKLQTRSYSPPPLCPPCRPCPSEILMPAPPGGQSASPRARREPCFCACGTTAFASLPANLCHACLRLAEAQARSLFQPFPVSIHVS